jgi:dUTPase
MEDSTIDRDGLHPMATIRARRLNNPEVTPMLAKLSDDSHRISMRLASGLIIFPEHRRPIHTGYCLNVPDGYVALAITDGTLARERGVVVAGGTKITVPGDTGELVVTMQNLGREPATLEAGTRIFSILLCSCPTIEFIEEDAPQD